MAAKVDTGPCKATDYNVVGLLELVSSSCPEGRLARCWAGVEVRQCKEADRTAGTDGNLALLSLVPLVVESEPNSAKAAAYTCPAGYGNIKSERALGVQGTVAAGCTSAIARQAQGRPGSSAGAGARGPPTATAWLYTCR